VRRVSGAVSRMGGAWERHRRIRLRGRVAGVTRGKNWCDCGDVRAIEESVSLASWTLWWCCECRHRSNFMDG
jgi:hypothetical protein